MEQEIGGGQKAGHIVAAAQEADLRADRQLCSLTQIRLWLAGADDNERSSPADGFG